MIRRGFGWGSAGTMSTASGRAEHSKPAQVTRVTYTCAGFERQYGTP